MVEIGAESVDFLTTCPSVSDIICYIKYNDIPNMKLVNRRMNNVIKRNAILLDRPTVSIIIQFVKFEVEYHVCIRVCADFGRKPANTYIITYDRIGLLDCPYEDYFLGNGTLLVDDTGSTGEKLRKAVARFHKVGFLSSCSLAAGVKCILSLIFRRFYFHEIHITNRDQAPLEQFFAIVVDEWKRSRSRCRRLKAIGFAKLEELRLVERVYTTMDSSVTLSHQNMQLTKLAPILNFDRDVEVCMKAEHFDSLKPIVSLLKQWQSGRVGRIGQLNIHAGHHPGAYQFSHLQLIEACQGLNVVDVYNIRSELYIHIQRPCDRMYLCIRYFEQSQLLLEQRNYFIS